MLNSWVFLEFFSSFFSCILWNNLFFVYSQFAMRFIIGLSGRKIVSYCFFSLHFLLSRINIRRFIYGVGKCHFLLIFISGMFIYIWFQNNTCHKIGQPIFKWNTQFFQIDRQKRFKKKQFFLRKIKNRMHHRLLTDFDKKTQTKTIFFNRNCLHKLN